MLDIFRSSLIASFLNSIGFIPIWHLLNETIDELLKVNPQCVVLSSMERRAADVIDIYIRGDEEYGACGISGEGRGSGLKKGER